MVYKKKLLVLSIITGVLALGYGAALVFNPDRLSSRNALFLWIDPKWLDQVDRVEIRGAQETGLVRRNDRWFAVLGDAEFPAKQSRVEDLLRLLSTRDAYPLRGTSAASHERLGLGEDAASRIVLRGGAGAPLLDLLVGDRDATGRERYFRRANQNEIRSGEDRLGPYIDGSPSSWYNLKLLPDAETLAPPMVQRITVVSPAAPPDAETPGAGTGSALVLTRNGQGWTLEAGGGEVPPGAVPDTALVDAYIRSVLDAEGDNFITTLSAQDPVFNEGRILLELENGNTRSIRLGPVVDLSAQGAEGQTRRSAAVAGSPYVYALADWTVNRIFKDAAYFVPQ